ncbi:hypothetical protein MHC_03115 [Mycoplasma haemocanis str. Illinois]|uniref:Uncharacterized protein n=1 Tax=Mycoplasma haemocanis (strain Illinois) TaxID=1111676 RepID=H6N761_MYCHN|nr:hypothetical protein [Mycoplasma haemocanis]AEW45483.1 hypothetical protein MHC_03115 [Mycoplasma haemocanis str. Illinois]
MVAPKLLIGIGTAGSVAGGGMLAYQLGAFRGKETLTTVRQRLKEKGYELISENFEDQWKTSFNAFKTNSSFMSELNKYSEHGTTLTDSDDGEKGKVALKRMCGSYLDGNNDFENASKWCVLRVQDKTPPKGWLPLTDGSSDAGDNKTKWENAFDKHKTSLSSNKIKGITESTQKGEGYELLKQWCSESLILPFNKDIDSIFTNASTWCSNA